MQTSNALSFVEFFDLFEGFIAAHEDFASDAELVTAVRQRHGILPLPHGLDPGCACPQANGTCSPP